MSKNQQKKAKKAATQKEKDNNNDNKENTYNALSQSDTSSTESLREGGPSDDPTSIDSSSSDTHQDSKATMAATMDSRQTKRPVFQDLLHHQDVSAIIDSRIAEVTAILEGSITSTIQSHMDVIARQLNNLVAQKDRLEVTHTNPPGGYVAVPAPGPLSLSNRDPNSMSNAMGIPSDTSGQYEYKTFPNGVKQEPPQNPNHNMMDTSSIGISHSDQTMFQTPMTVRSSTTGSTIPAQGTVNTTGNTTTSSLDATLPIPISMNLKHATISNSFLGNIHAKNATVSTTGVTPPAMVTQPPVSGSSDNAALIAEFVKAMARSMSHPTTTTTSGSSVSSVTGPSAFVTGSVPVVAVPSTATFGGTTGDTSKTFTLKEEYRGMSPTLDCKAKLPSPSESPFLPAVGELTDNRQFNRYINRMKEICNKSTKYGSMLINERWASWRVFWNGNKKYHDNIEKLQLGFLQHTYTLSQWILDTIPVPLSDVIKNKLKREIGHFGLIMGFATDVIIAQPEHYHDPWRILQEITKVYRKDNPLAIIEYQTKLRNLRLNPSADPEIYINEYDAIVNEALAVVPGFRVPTEAEMYGHYYVQWPETLEHGVIFRQLERDSEMTGSPITVAQLQKELIAMYKHKNSRGYAMKSLISTSKYTSTYKSGMYPSTIKTPGSSGSSSKVAMSNATSESHDGDDETEDNGDDDNDYDEASVNATSHMATRSPKFNSHGRNKGQRPPYYNNGNQYPHNNGQGHQDRRGSQSPHRPHTHGSSSYNKSPNELAQLKQSKEGTQPLSTTPTVSSWNVGDSEEDDDNDGENGVHYLAANFTLGTKSDISRTSTYSAMSTSDSSITSSNATQGTGRADTERILDDTHAAIDHCTDLSITPRLDLLTNVRDLKRPIYVTTIGGIAKHKVTKQGTLKLGDGRLVIHNCKYLSTAPYTIICGNDLTRAGLNSIYTSEGCNLIPATRFAAMMPSATGLTLEQFCQQSRFVLIPTKGKMCVIALSTSPSEDPTSNVTFKATGDSMIPRVADRGSVRQPSGETISSGSVPVVPSVSFRDDSSHPVISVASSPKERKKSKSPKQSQSAKGRSHSAGPPSGVKPQAILKTPVKFKDNVIGDKVDPGANYITQAEDIKRQEEQKVFNNKRPTAQQMQEAQDRLKGRTSTSGTSSSNATNGIISIGLDSDDGYQPTSAMVNATTRSFTIHRSDSPAAPIRTASSSIVPEELHGYDTGDDTVTFSSVTHAKVPIADENNKLSIVHDHQQYESEYETDDIIDSQVYDHVNGKGFSEEM